MKIQPAAAVALALVLIAPIAFNWRVLTRADRTIPGAFLDYHLPHLVVMHEARAAGQFPFWDKYNYCGRPFAANPNTEAFYPPRWITVAASSRPEDLVGRLELEVIAHLLLAGVFAALLARRLACAWPAASLAGVAYACGCFFASQLQHVGLMEGAAWLPAVWWAVARLVEKPVFPSTALVSMFFAVTILTGSTWLLVIYTSAALFAAIFVGWMRTPMLPVLLHFFAAAFISILLAGISVMPLIELAFHSADTSLIAPSHDITQPYLFSGYIPLALVAAAAFLLRRNRAAIGLLALMALAALLMLGDKTFLGTAWMMAFSLAVAAVSAMALQHLRLPTMVQFVIVAATAGELIWFSSGTPLNSGERPPYPSAIPELQGSRYDVTTAAGAVVARAPLLGATSANGDDALALERVMQSRRFVGAGNTVEQPDAPMLEAMNVDTLLAREPLPGSFPKWDLVQSTPDLLYKRHSPSKRFWFVQSVVRLNGLQEAIDAARKPDWSPRTIAVVEQGRLKTATQPSAVGTVTPVVDRPGEIRLRTANSGPGLLLVSEAHYPGWRAQIDGKLARILPANIAFQGLWVPAGEHDVLLSYSPTIFGMGAALSIVAAIGVALGLVFTRLRKAYSSAIS